MLMYASGSSTTTHRTMYQMIMCNVRGGAHSDEPKDSAAPFFAEFYNKCQLLV